MSWLFLVRSFTLKIADNGSGQWSFLRGKAYTVCYQICSPTLPPPPPRPQPHHTHTHHGGVGGGGWFYNNSNILIRTSVPVYKIDNNVARQFCSYRGCLVSLTRLTCFLWGFLVFTLTGINPVLFHWPDWRFLCFVWFLLWLVSTLSCFTDPTDVFFFVLFWFLLWYQPCLVSLTRLTCFLCFVLVFTLTGINPVFFHWRTWILLRLVPTTSFVFFNLITSDVLRVLTYPSCRLVSLTNVGFTLSGTLPILSSCFTD